MESVVEKKQVPVNGFEKFKEKIVDFVKKGSVKRKTKMRIKELTEARLRKVPNYVAVEVAKKQINVAKDMVILLMFTLLLMSSCMSISLASKLDKRLIALVPGRIEKVTEVKPGEVSPIDLFRKVSSYVSLMGNVSKENIDFNYDLLKEIMTEELKIKFEADNRELKNVVKSSDLSQRVSFSKKDIEMVTQGKVIRTLVKVVVTPYYKGEAGKARHEYILMEGEVVVKKENNFWELQLYNLEPGDMKDYEGVKRRLKGRLK